LVRHKVVYSDEPSAVRNRRRWHLDGGGRGGSGRVSAARFDKRGREDSLAAPNGPTGPVVVNSLQDRHDVTFLQRKVALLVRHKVVYSDGQFAVRASLLCTSRQLCTGLPRLGARWRWLCNSITTITTIAQCHKTRWKHAGESINLTAHPLVIDNLENSDHLTFAKSEVAILLRAEVGDAAVLHLTGGGSPSSVGRRSINLGRRQWGCVNLGRRSRRRRSSTLGRLNKVCREKAFAVTNPPPPPLSIIVGKHHHYVTSSQLEVAFLVGGKVVNTDVFPKVHGAPPGGLIVVIMWRKRRYSFRGLGGPIVDHRLFCSVTRLRIG